MFPYARSLPPEIPGSLGSNKDQIRIIRSFGNRLEKNSDVGGIRLYIRFLFHRLPPLSLLEQPIRHELRIIRQSLPMAELECGYRTSEVPDDPSTPHQMSANGAANKLTLWIQVLPGFIDLMTADGPHKVPNTVSFHQMPCSL